MDKMQKSSVEHKLRERVKELTCLYDVTSAVLQHDGTIDVTLDRICNIVKAAYQYPNDAVIELWLESHYILTAAIPASSVSQVSAINVFEEDLGFIKVHYNMEIYSSAHFLDEEQLLLDKVAHEIGNFFDKLIITGREKLFQSNIAQADRRAVLHEITAGIAHELNTPLANILGFAELIKENDLSVQINEDVSKIIKSAIYSREIVKKLLLFSGEMPSNPEVINVKESILQCLSILSPNFRKKSLDFLFLCDDQSYIMFFDNIQLTQIIFNLALNAIYASPDGGIIKVRLYKEKRVMVIEMEDEGEGVPEKLMSKVFEPFFTTKPVGVGTGLGLSVVQGIVKTNGGTIQILANKPLGAVFKIRLPIIKKYGIEERKSFDS